MHPTAPTSRQQRRGWTAVLAAVLVVAGAVWWVGSRPHDDRLDWQPLAVDGSATLRIRGDGGSCDGPGVAHVSETASTVTIRVTERRHSGSCGKGTGQLKPVTVTLKAPLGQRALRGCDQARKDRDCRASGPLLGG